MPSEDFLERKMAQESHVRSIVKAFSWRVTGSFDTFIISWLITGKATVALTITGIELFSKVALYWAHERVWLRVKWGAASDGGVVQNL